MGAVNAGKPGRPPDRAGMSGEGAVCVEDLVAELHALSRGRGVMAPDLPGRVGAGLRCLSGIDPGVSPAQFRRQLIAFLDAVADTADLPVDLRHAFSAAFALRREFQQARSLNARLDLILPKLKRGRDTARKYLDEAIKEVAATLVQGDAVPTSRLAATVDSDGDGSFPSGWHLAELRVLLDLCEAQPIAFEDRTVVADVDELAEVAISTAIPRHGTTDLEARRVDLSVRYGGVLAGSEWPSPTYLRYSVRLPRTLRRGEEQQIGVRLAIPAGQPFNPMYTFTPLLRCDDFDLRVKFGSRGTDTRIWRIAGLPPGMADDFAESAELIRVDAAGEIHLRYERPRIGFSYGARWTELSG